MKIRLIALLAVVALAVMAVPASASDVAVFTGTATVSAGDRGLFVPVVTGAPLGGIDGTWEFESATGTCNAASGICEISADGDLGENAAGIGASCGMSSGSGTGSYTDGNSVTTAITSIGWITSAGGTLPLVGATASGPIAGVVQAQGAAPCADTYGAGAGAEDFTIVGVAALV